MLALAQIMPIPYLGLGYVAAGALMVAGAFPAAALAGLALDLARITPVPMTAVLTAGYVVRFLPIKQGLFLLPGLMYVLLMSLWGQMDFYPLPGLVLGESWEGSCPWSPPSPTAGEKRGYSRCGWRWFVGCWPRQSSC